MDNFWDVTDVADPRLAPYAKLTEAQLAAGGKQHGFVAESPNVIALALDAGCAPLSILVERTLLKGPALDIIRRCPGVPVYVGENRVLEQITGYRLTRGLLCHMVRPPLRDAEELLVSARRIAVLEDVVNPTNLGAIFRSAAALNMDAVLLTPGCSDPLYRRCARVSMGTVFQVPWAYFPRPVGYLREMGFGTVAMALRPGSRSVDDPALREKPRLAVILGNEGAGLAQSTIDQCDDTVMIPMSHGVDSLNVAAASAVAFWALGR